MYLKDNEGITKYIHVFRSHLEQFPILESLIPTILILIRSLLLLYKSFINSLSHQLVITF